MDHIIERRLWALEEMVERFCRCEISNDCEIQFVLPRRMCFDDIFRFSLGPHRCSHGVSTLRVDQPAGIGGNERHLPTFIRMARI